MRIRGVSHGHWDYTYGTMKVVTVNGVDEHNVFRLFDTMGVSRV